MRAWRNCGATVKGFLHHFDVAFHAAIPRPAAKHAQVLTKRRGGNWSIPP